ncbi:hypothetical protein C8J57DRAFT_1391223, partial [Mycena rebaudengoi]
GLGTREVSRLVLLMLPSSLSSRAAQECPPSWPRRAGHTAALRIHNFLRVLGIPTVPYNTALRRVLLRHPIRRTFGALSTFISTDSSAEAA